MRVCAGFDYLFCAGGISRPQYLPPRIPRPIFPSFSYLLLLRLSRQRSSLFLSPAGRFIRRALTLVSSWVSFCTPLLPYTGRDASIARLHFERLRREIEARSLSLATRAYHYCYRCARSYRFTGHAVTGRTTIEETLYGCMRAREL